MRLSLQRVDAATVSEYAAATVPLESADAVPVFEHDGLSFNYREVGEGLPFVFQHGLTADVNQPFGLVSPPAGVRMIGLDCRSHGQTRPLTGEKIGLVQFADDVAALLDHLKIERAVIGGISMGSAISLIMALRRPERVLGLVVSRPAWLAGPLPENVELYTTVADLIGRHGAREGQSIFKQSDLYARTLRESPAVAATLVSTFELPQIEERIALLDRIPRDQPYQSLGELSQIRVPTLVLANRRDPVHPYEVGRAIAEAIPGAEFQELTPKSVDPDQHKQDVQAFISMFLVNRFLNGSPGRKV